MLRTGGTLVDRSAGGRSLEGTSTVRAAPEGGYFTLLTHFGFGGSYHFTVAKSTELTYGAARHVSSGEETMRASHAPEETEITVPVSDLRIRIMAPATRDESGDRLSFWWGLTSAAVALSRNLGQLGDLSGTRVIELGCGLGLAGITAGLRGASVTFTDYMPEALDFARRNAALNGLKSERTRFVRIDWDEPHELGTFPLIVGSEIVYDYFTHGSLIHLMDRLTAPYGRVLLAERKRLAVSRFLGRLTHKGFVSSSETMVDLSMPGFPDQRITVFSLQRTKT